MAGNAIPVSPGTANVTVGYNGLTTVVPVTVSAAPPPSLPNPSGLGFTGDDFTSYANTAGLQRVISPNIGGSGGGTILYNDGVNGQNASIDESVTYNGHHTMNYIFPSPTGQPELWPLFSARTNVWFRAMIRFVPGFTTAGVGPGATGSNAYKLMGLSLNTALYDASLRLEITNTTEYVCYWGASSKTTGAQVINTDTSNRHVGNISTEWSDGAWYQYILNYRTSGINSFCDTYLGRNAVLPTLRSQGTAPNLDGLAAPACNGVCCGLNYNRTRSTSQIFNIWYGFWEAVDGNDHPNPFGLVLP